MYTTTAAFRAKLLESHTIMSYVDVLVGAAETRRLYVVDGSVTVKNADAIGRSCQLTLVDPDGTLAPHDAEDLLSPAGTEVKPYRGIALDDGSMEMIPQGVFGLDETAIEENEDGGVTISLTGYDRAKVVGGPIGHTMAIAAGTLIEDAIRLLVFAKLPTATFNLANTKKVTSTILLTDDDDPWATAQTLAQSASCKLFFDRNGVCTMRAIGATLTPPTVPQYNEGANATFMSPKRTLSVSDAANVVVVNGSSSGSGQIRGEAADNNPGSRTYVGGPFGRRVLTIESSLIWTQDQADALASAKLNEVIGNSEQMTFEAIPDPALDEGDVVHIARPKLGVNGRQLVVDTIELPMAADGTMKVTAQRSLLVPDEEDTLASISAPRRPLYRTPPGAAGVASATPPRILASDVTIRIPAGLAAAGVHQPSIFAGRVDIAMPAAMALAGAGAPGIAGAGATSGGFGVPGYGAAGYGTPDGALSVGFGAGNYGTAGYGI